jgi:Leucine-rich repeat (LRR) protein
MTDADVAPLSGLSALEVLDLSRNSVSMSGVGHLLSAALPLRKLDVSSNSISDSSLERGNTDLATSAAAGAGNISSSCPAAGRTLLGDHIDAPGPAAVEHAMSSSLFSSVAATLQGLTLTHNSLKLQGVTPLIPLQFLKQLNISSCGITDQGLAGLGQLTSLQRLNLAHNNGITEVEGLLGELGQLTGLQQLVLDRIGMQESEISKVIDTLTLNSDAPQLHHCLSRQL